MCFVMRAEINYFKLKLNMNAPSFNPTLQKRKRAAPSFQHLLADGQLLIYVADAVSPSIKYLWF